MASWLHHSLSSAMELRRSVVSSSSPLTCRLVPRLDRAAEVFLGQSYALPGGDAKMGMGSSRSTVAMARSFGISSSKPAGWMLEPLARVRRS